MIEPIEMNVDFSTQDTEMNVEEDMNCRVEIPLPIASATTLGGIKVGENLSITEDGTLSVDLKATEIVDTASGAIASFADGSDGVPVRDLKVQMEPIQAGSGDPSPTNIRPITGRDSVTVTRTGKNLLPMRRGYSFPYNANVGSVLDVETTVSNWTDEGGGFFSIELDNWERSGWLSEKIRSGTTITFRNIFVSGSAKTTVYVLDKNFTVTRKTGVANPVLDNDTFKFTFTLASNECYLAIAIIGGGQKIIVNNPQIELSSTATDYEPYSGQTVTIQLGQTVYGGTLDVTQGVLTVDRAMVDLGTLNWVYNTSWASFGVFTMDLSEAKTFVADSKLNCSDYSQTATNSSSNVETVALMSDGQIQIKQISKQIYIRDSRYTDATSFKTAMSGVQLCYELAQPVTVQLTAQQMTTLLGQNNVWSDADSVSVDYVADTKLYIAKVIADALA